jgi:hypothetical protein
MARLDGPHWAMSETDAKHYAQAWANALRHLPVGRSQKAVDFSALVMAIGLHEGIRLQHSLELKRQREQARRQQAGQFPGSNSFTFTAPEGAFVPPEAAQH